MKASPTKMICLACGVFRHELDALQAQGDIDFPIQYLDSVLHIYPKQLRNRLDSIITDHRETGCKILLLYGECHAYMCDQESLPGVYRVRGRNCAEILLGPDLYRTLQKEGAFIFLPEWTIRWREIFHKELGLDGETEQDFMKEMRTKLTYIDTGVIPVPTEHLQAASSAMGLPWEVIRVGPDRLLAAIREAMERMAAHVG